MASVWDRQDSDPSSLDIFFFYLGTSTRKQTQIATKKVLKLWDLITLPRLLTCRDGTGEIPHPSTDRIGPGSWSTELSCSTGQADGLWHRERGRTGHHSGDLRRPHNLFHLKTFVHVKGLVSPSRGGVCDEDEFIAPLAYGESCWDLQGHLGDMPGWPSQRGLHRLTEPLWEEVDRLSAHGPGFCPRIGPGGCGKGLRCGIWLVPWGCLLLFGSQVRKGYSSQSTYFNWVINEALFELKLISLIGFSYPSGRKHSVNLVYLLSLPRAYLRLKGGSRHLIFESCRRFLSYPVHSGPLSPVLVHSSVDHPQASLWQAFMEPSLCVCLSQASTRLSVPAPTGLEEAKLQCPAASQACQGEGVYCGTPLCSGSALPIPKHSGLGFKPRVAAERWTPAGLSLSQGFLDFLDSLLFLVRPSFLCSLFRGLKVEWRG